VLRARVSAVTSSVLPPEVRLVETMVLDIAPDRVGDEVADRAAGGDAGTNLGRREAQPRRIEEVDARVDAREVLVEPRATRWGEAAAGYDGDPARAADPRPGVPRREAA